MRYGAKSKATPQDWGMVPLPGMHVHIKAVKCGKAACRVCPHYHFAYARWLQDGKRKEKYLGKCTEFGFPDRNVKLV